MLLWRRRKWRCRVDGCERKVFTESLPEQIPARSRITTRARRLAAEAIGDHTRPGTASNVRSTVFHGEWQVLDRAIQLAKSRLTARKQKPPTMP